MVQGTGVGAAIDSRAVPVMPEAMEFASMGLVPAGAHRNRLFREAMVRLAPGVSPIVRDVLFDPQTSGGLLFGCREEDAPEIEKRLADAGVEAAAIIGRVTGDNGELIQVI